MRDAVEEPVLKQIAGLIAADEFAHYRLFYDLMQIQPETKPPLWKRAWIAASRVQESEDDELAYAYYCGNVPADRDGARQIRSHRLQPRLPVRNAGALPPHAHRKRGLDGRPRDRPCPALADGEVVGARSVGIRAHARRQRGAAAALPKAASQARDSSRAALDH